MQSLAHSTSPYCTAAACTCGVWEHGLVTTAKGNYWWYLHSIPSSLWEQDSEQPCDQSQPASNIPSCSLCPSWAKPQRRHYCFVWWDTGEATDDGCLQMASSAFCSSARPSASLLDGGARFLPLDHQRAPHRGRQMCTITRVS